ncbi:MAG: choice-of-anchor D domain-containing protein, partial [Bacteroidota bacterium]
MMSPHTRFFVPLFFLIPLMFAQAQWSSDPALNNAICREGSSQNAPRIISDGRAGAIICWHDQRASQNSFDIYAQRIDKDGFVRWTVNGNVVSAAWNSQSKPDIVSDGSGGAIIAWTDTRNDNNDIYVQRIDSSGNVLWTTDGVAVTSDTSNEADPKIASDGKHGIIVTWNTGTGGFPPGSKIYARRVDATGTLRWVSQVLVSGTLRFSNAPCITSDGNGGAFIAYAYYPRPEYDVYAQHIDSGGVVLWAKNGVGIATGGGTQDSPALVADGTGNAFLTYSDWSSGTTANLHVVVLKKDGTTAASFRATSTNGGQIAQQSSLVGTGLLGLAWQDGRTSGKNRVYAQIIDTTGTKSWAANGVEVSNRAGDQFTPYVVTDGNGGMIVAWEDKTKGVLESDIYAQRLSGTGSLLWSSPGVAIGTAAKIQQLPWMISDGQNGAIITWEDYRPSLSNSEIYASRILADGTFPIGPPLLTFSSKLVAFGAVAVGSSSTKNITLTNSGGVPVTIASITSNDPHFSLSPDNNTIAPSGNATAAVRFQPTSKDALNAFIVIQSNSIFGPDTVRVTGSGTASAAMQTDKTALNFGDVKRGSSKSLAIKITNAGNDTLTISSISTNSPRFTVDIASRVLLPGASFDDT